MLSVLKNEEDVGKGRKKKQGSRRQRSWSEDKNMSKGTEAGNSMARSQSFLASVVVKHQTSIEIKEVGERGRARPKGASFIL